MEKGGTLHVPTLGYTKRLNCFVSLFWPQKWIVWNCYKRRRNIEFRKHLYNIVAYAKRHRLGKVILFADRATYHRTPQVKKYVKRSQVLKIKYLPNKDPNANPTECLVNKRLSAAVGTNRCHSDYIALGAATRSFLRKYNSTYTT
ncbi:MAG: transposase [Candidatus Zixiibacteriota bacterium]